MAILTVTCNICGCSFQNKVTIVDPEQLIEIIDKGCPICKSFHWIPTIIEVRNLLDYYTSNTTNYYN